MAANDRLYNLSLTTRPAYFGDLGHRLQISGVLFTGEETSLLVLYPSMAEDYEVPWQFSFSQYGKIVRPSLEEWQAILKETDDPKYFEIDPTGGIKAVHRKAGRVISTGVQQKIWQRDNYRCQYCGIKMGNAVLSVDHFEPLEFGGIDDPTNYLTACRGCNKKKGSMMATDWCRKINRSYEAYKHYMKTVTIEGVA